MPPDGGDERVMLIYKDKQYSVPMDYIQNEHPGGPEYILEYINHDMTEAFDDADHSTEALDLLQGWLVNAAGDKPVWAGAPSGVAAAESSAQQPIARAATPADDASLLARGHVSEAMVVAAETNTKQHSHPGEYRNTTSMHTNPVTDAAAEAKLDNATGSSHWGRLWLSSMIAMCALVSLTVVTTGARMRHRHRCRHH